MHNTGSVRTITIGGREISRDAAPFIIAELSGNHSHSLDTARAMIKAAAESGAHAIKLQTYTADSMTLDVEEAGFVIEEKDSLWYGASLYSLYQQAATPYEWHSELFDYAKSLGMLAFSSPFDEAAVDFLDELDVPCFKIASFELTDIPLIRKAAGKGKPLIMSTGMASLSEIELAVDTARHAGCEDIILLKCTSTYPAEPVNTNLTTIPHLRSAFNCEVGLSDHTGGIGAAVASVALGASVIEKHFVLDRNGGGVDAAFSLEPQELSTLVIETERAWQALGEVKYGGTLAEDKAKQYRRSIYVSRDIQPGETLAPDNLKIVRPAFGLAPKHWDAVLHKKATRHIKKGTALSWEHIGE
ncbi:MAG: pseudaminic acid synthase [Alteromonadaceae bacterium TMED7]|nr:pseudaminic acid synthase [Alteromonadaceae bacterium]RPH16988.1 MAG: pseudaminic acid synthase [Alteromonadaceae bacterium TMED7]|tara:strand:+ start:50772 stop:51845 length:1074 start_codon:yes stop_codon:yes gene_type:complete